MGKMETIACAMQPLEISYRQLSTYFDPEYGIIWSVMNPSGVPCFNLELLSELEHYHLSIENSGGSIRINDQPMPIKYAVAASGIPGVFNLGGDLAQFVRWIRNGDRPSLEHYAMRCIDSMAARIRHCSLPLVTISLVQGDALGGGFEAALTSDIIIAERGIKMGFPEILFNLFPGMGAYSFIARKIGTMQAERIIMSGKLYTAEELHEIGLVDVLTGKGEGEDAVYEYVRRQHRHSNGYLALQKARQRFNPVTCNELMDIAMIWVDAALQLNERDLRIMDRFVFSQNKLLVHDDRRRRHGTLGNASGTAPIYRGGADRRKAVRSHFSASC